MKKYESRTSAGHLEVTFQRFKGSYKSEDPQFAHFININRERAVQYNLGNQKPVTFALKIKIADRISSVIENSMEFRKDILDIVHGDSREQFFKACGSSYVHAVRFDTDIHFFFAYYPKSPADSDFLENLIAKRLTKESENILKIKIFDELVFDTETYFSMQIQTDRIFEPIEFPFSHYHKKKIEDFLNQVVVNAHNSNFGTVKAYETAPWSKLDKLRAKTSLNGDDRITENSDESIYNSLQLLENSIDQFNMRRFQVGRLLSNQNGEESNLFACSQLLKEAARDINWDNFQKCRDEAIVQNKISSKGISACTPIISAITKLNRRIDCVIDIEEELPSELTLLNDDIYRPVQLVDHAVDEPLSIHRKQTNYRFNDEDQYEIIPEPVVLGQGMDQNGARYDNCIIEKSKTYTENQEQRTQSLTNDYYPVTYEEWPLWKKILQFWRKSPRWTIYRGSIEIQGLSKKLNPDFDLTKEAYLALKTGLMQFYKTCGTHYISHFGHRRGFTSYFSPNSPDDDKIELIPFGRAESDFPGVTHDVLEQPVDLPPEQSVDLTPEELDPISQLDLKSVLMPKTVKE
ncbi:MAG: hypothetical protein GY786_03805, partial [Proteobacteria bacterium]|nr:hypothetical protein [Pseudomonadota bacterium]